MTSSPVSSLNIFLFSAPKFRFSGIKILLSLLQDSIHEGTSAPLVSSIPLSGNGQFILQNQLSRCFPQGDFLLDPVCPDSFIPVCTPGPQLRFLPRTAFATTHSILTVGKIWLLSLPPTRDFFARCQLRRGCPPVLRLGKTHRDPGSSF